MALLNSSLSTLRLAQQAVGPRTSNIFISRVVTYMSPITAKRLTHSESGSEKKLTKTAAIAQLKNYVQLTKDISSTPAAPLALGFSGLIPFFYPPLAMMSSGAFSSSLMFMHMAYGATILSFIGGLRWGYCLSPSSKTPPSWLYMGYSVMPQLVGWAALMMPTTLGIFTVASGLVACAIADITMPGYPSWFVSMRVILTTGAVVSLLLSFWCVLMLR